MTTGTMMARSDRPTHIVVGGGRGGLVYLFEI